MKKKVKVVMYSTMKNTNALWWSGQNLYLKGPEDPSRGELNHLYLLSDEEIRIGDWFVSEPRQTIHKCTAIFEDNLIDNSWENRENVEITKNDCKKIIATTDLLSNTIKSSYVQFGTKVEETRIEYLPKLSQDFLKFFVDMYNQDKIIVSVNVEYDEDVITCNDCYKVNGYINSPDCCGEYYVKEAFKVNKENEINIIL